MVERAPVKRLVVGSNPTRGARKISLFIKVFFDTFFNVRTSLTNIIIYDTLFISTVVHYGRDFLDKVEPATEGKIARAVSNPKRKRQSDTYGTALFYLLKSGI